MVSNKDKNILRKLAGKVREIANLPEMEERKKRLYRINDLKPDRPIVLCFPEGSWCELLPDNVLECEDEKLRKWEMELKRKIYWWEYIKDDNAIEPYFNIPWCISVSDFGVEVKYTHGENRGSFIWEPPIKDLNKDIEKLKFRELRVDREQTMRDFEIANEIFGDLLKVRIKGKYWWTVGLTIEAIKLIGLENLMLFMYDQPEGLHRFMKWMSDEQLHFIEWFEKEGLLSLQNEDDYVGSGGVGYTTELPQRDFKEGDIVRLKDIWGFAESQETVGVSPEMFNEFIFQYQLPLLNKFGLNCYGCCEPLDKRIDYVFKIPNLKRISVSPWSNQEFMAKKLGKNYVFSRKPNPALICASFNEDLIRKDIRYTLEVTRGCVLEIIMKDTHTVQNEPMRISRWVKIALEEISKYMG
jgi:hypothetical protein